MRIAVLHWGFPPIIGGVETHLRVLYPELIQMGHRVSLLTGSFAGVKNRYRYKGMNVFRTPLMDLNWLYERGTVNLGKDLTRAVRGFLDEAKPDVIHAHNMNYFSRVHAVVLKHEAHMRKVPLVLTAHNAWDDNQFMQLTNDIGWDHIIAVSRFIKREISGIGYPAPKITVIHHGIDLERFRNIKKGRIYQKYPQLRNRKIIFHPARMGLAKGNDVSVKALRLVKKKIPEAMLVMAGTKNIIDWGKTQQKDIAFIVHLIRKFHLEDDILINMFTVDEVAGIYAVAALSYYPSSVAEPFGLTMLESMASGKPMIVTRAGGMPEIIKNNVNGFVVSPRNHEALARRTIQLLKNDKLRKKLGSNGLQMVRKKYNKRRMAEQVAAVYAKVAGSNRPEQKQD